MAKIEITQPPSGGTVNEGVLQIEGGGPITNSSQRITDQSGNTSPLYISSTSLTITTPTSLTAGTRLVIQGTTDSAGYILRAVNRTGSEIFNIKDDGSTLSLGPVAISTIANATTNTDKFLVSDSGVIKYRTGIELLSDLGISNPVTGTGAATRVAFWSSGSAISSSSALNWDNTNGYLGVNTASPVAQLQVRGNAVAGNNVARFETQSLVNLFTLSEEGKITAFAPQINALSGTTEINKFTSSFAASSAGSGSFRPLSIAYTINNAAGQTGTATGIFLSATETALGGMTHNLIDMQVGGVSALKTSSLGNTSVGVNKAFTSSTSYTSLSTSTTFSQTVASNSFLVSGVSADVVFSGTSGFTTASGIFSRATITNTSTSNAIKAGAFSVEINGSGNFTSVYAVDASVAIQNTPITSSSAICVNASISKSSTGTVANVYGIRIDNIVNSSGTITNTYGIYTGDLTAGTQTNQAYSMYLSDANARTYIAGQTSIGVATAVASAILQTDSTTQGFLPPRMTTTQKNLIAAATGLVVYDTTLNKLAVYTGAAWEAVTSV
jgi:hypothetical protein